MYGREYGGLTLSFEASGALKESSLVMRDLETDSWWSIMTGDAIGGELEGTRLEELPVGEKVRWEEWRRRHPDTLVLTLRDMEHWPRNAHGNTYGGNPICCAAALATLELVEEEYSANAAVVGDYFMERLRELQTRHQVIGEVRGKGLMIGIELVTDRNTKEPARELCDAVLHRAFHNGLILLSCGASTVRFMPPLMITPEDVDEALTILEASLEEALER